MFLESETVRLMQFYAPSRNEFISKAINLPSRKCGRGDRIENVEVEPKGLALWPTGSDRVCWQN
jgi:hypothetical protein